jgi:hypothetical protein
MLAYSTRHEMRGRVGLVVPVWFPEDLPDAVCETLLRTTLADCSSCLRPEHVALVVDGVPRLAALAERLSAELGGGLGECVAPTPLRGVPPPGGAAFQVLAPAVNQGKGGALVVGWEALLADPALEFIATRDADGDHFLDDLPHLFRLGEQMSCETGSDRVVVIGRRTAVHPPLGWLRGEYEQVVNAMLVEALQFSLARRGYVLPRQYWAADVPDLQSGYKLYSRAACAEAVRALRKADQEHPELQPLRRGMEILPFAAVCAAGGIAGEAPRATYYDQPVTSYGRVDRVRFFGDPLAWSLCELEVAPDAARGILDNALARSTLMTDPDGRRELLALRRHTLETLAALRSVDAGELPDPHTRQFL